MTRFEFEIRMPLRHGAIGRSYPAWLEWGRTVPYRFRRFHRWWSRFAGFFWLPCPLCGHEFGGHEWRDIDGKPSSARDPLQPNMRRGICPQCTRAGRGDP